MYTRSFSIIWTVLMTMGVFYFWREPDFARQPLFFQIIMTTLPLAGFLFMWDSLRKLRRFRSVRCEEDAGKPLYIWTEFDGSERRSSKDPRPAWDEEDRDCAD
jgi:hypothetical protein